MRGRETKPASPTLPRAAAPSETAEPKPGPLYTALALSGVLGPPEGPSEARRAYFGPGARVDVTPLLATAWGPLVGGMRSTLERAYDSPLDDVRVHAGEAAAQASSTLGARAFTVGRDVFLGAGSHAESLAHEVAHVVQNGAARRGGPVEVGRPSAPEEAAAHRASEVALAGGYAGPLLQPSSEPGVLRRDSVFATEPPKGLVRDVDPDRPTKIEPAPATDELEELGQSEASVYFSIKDPDHFLFTELVSASQIASILYGDERYIDRFDIRPPRPDQGGIVLRVRPRETATLVGSYSSVFRIAYETILDDEVNAVVEILKHATVSEAEQWKLADKTLEWSQRSVTLDEQGRTLFDRFLDALSARKLADSAGVSRTCYEWLLLDAGPQAEQIKKAIEIRSFKYRGTTGYAVTDGAPELKHGDVVGRYYSSVGTGVQIKVRWFIAQFSSRAQAEIDARTPEHIDDLRIIVPGEDGRWRLYTLDASELPGRLAAGSDPAGHYHWYYPGTLSFEPGEFRAEYAEGGAEEKASRRYYFEGYLKQATPSNPAPLYGMDYQLLAQATPAERKRILEIVLLGQGPTTKALGLLERLLMSVPKDQFREFERTFTRADLLHRLLSGDQTEMLGLGQAYTLKSIEALYLGGDVFEQLAVLTVPPPGSVDPAGVPSFTIGDESSGHMTAGFSADVEMDVERVAPENWAAADTPSAAREPTLPGEAPGIYRRSGIRIDLVRQKTWSNPTVTRSVSLLPSQLVRVEIQGAQPDTRLVSAFEAGIIASTFARPLALRQGMASINALLWARAGLGLGKAFGPALARGLLAGGARLAWGQLLRTAATQAGKKALKEFLVEAAFLGSMQLVEHFRADLEKTWEGRAFLRAYDVVMIAFAAHGIYRLLSSGAITKLGLLGLNALRSLGQVASVGLRRSVDFIQALGITFSKMLPSEVEVAAESGFRFVRPKDTRAFFHRVAAEEAKLISTRVLGSLGGTARGTFERLLKLLEKAAKTSDAAARAYRDLARKVEGLAAADAEALLGSVENVLKLPRRTAEDLADFLRAAVRAADPKGFLDQVRVFLSARAGLTSQTVRNLGAKALTKKIDLGWLSKTSLTDADLNLLARDSNTPWKLFERAGDPNDVAAAIYAKARLRGIAGEAAAEELLGKLIPGHRVVEAQVPMGTSILDFVISNTLGTKFALEVKGWTRKTWLEVKEAMTAASRGVALTEEQARAASAGENMITQLRNGKTALGTNPYLAVSEAIPDEVEDWLKKLLRRRVPGTTLVKMPESAITTISRRLRLALGIP